MTKRKAVAVLLVVVLAVTGVIIANGNKTVYGISEGFYLMGDKEAVSPYISFDLSQQHSRFMMGAGMMYSFANFGTVELKNGFVYLHVDNGGETWVFRVKDNDKIIFNEKKSDKCQLAENVILVDGDTFLFWDN